MDDIFCISLPNGANLIGEVNKTEDVFIISKVLQLIEVEKEEGMGMIAVDYMPYTEGEFIYHQTAVGLSKPAQQLLESYAKKFGRIITPPTSIITSANG